MRLKNGLVFRNLRNIIGRSVLKLLTDEIVWTYSQTMVKSFEVTDLPGMPAQCNVCFSSLICCMLI
jgi:hypothetical protein